jgi:hypothetical protein
LTDAAGHEAKGADDDGAGVSSLSRAAERIRESAKWLLVSFAGVGATLIAGLQLANVGALTNNGPEDRLTWAIVALAVGLLGVVFAIAAASSVVTKSFVTLKGIAEAAAEDAARKGIDGDEALLGGYESVGELQSAYEEAMKERRDKLKAYFEAPDDAKRSAAEAADKWAIALGSIQRNVLEQSSFNRVRAAYGTARWGILIGAAMTAAGIAIFAWATNPPKAELVPLVMDTPTEVVVRVDPEDRKIFKPKLGPKCDLSSVDAVALDTVGSGYKLASVPHEDCQAAVFVLERDEGTVAPQEILTPGTPAAPHSG